MGLPVPTTAPRLTPDQCAQVKQQLQPGDVILQSDDGYPGWQIAERVAVGADFTHVALYAGDGDVIDADSGVGVSRHDVDEILAAHRIAVVRPRYASEVDRSAAVAYAQRMVGRPFDAVFNTADDGAFYCAELVRNALASMPHPIALPVVKALGLDVVTPDAVRHIPEVDLVWTSGGSFPQSMAGHWPVAASGLVGAALLGGVSGPLGAAAGFAVGATTATLVGDLLDPVLRVGLRAWWQSVVSPHS